MALNNLAWLLGKQGKNTREGLRLAEQAYEVAPGPLTADTLGWLHYRAGDLSRASARLRESLTWDADNPSVLYRLGVVLAKLGKNDEALAVLDRALRAATRFQEAQEAQSLRLALSTKESRPASR